MSHLDIAHRIPEEELIEDDEISPLEYARQNGLARNYLSDAMTSFRNINNIIMQHVESPIDDDPNLPIFSLGPEIRLEERMTLTQDAAKLLSAIARPESIESINLATSISLDVRRRKKLKLELPLLKSDHERDCKEFARRDTFEIKLQDIKLPLELIDEEKGEGLGWPRSLRAYGQEIIDQAKKEKIMVKRDTMTFIQNSVRIEWTTDDENGLWASEQKYKRTNTIDPITPPLLSPVIQTMKYEPSPEAEGFDMPILTDTPDLTKLDLEMIEKRIFEEDIPTPIRRIAQGVTSDVPMGDRTISMKDIYSPLASSKQSPQPEEEKRFKPEDYKVETPLTPVLPTASPTKAVRFSGIIMQCDYDPGSPSKSDGLESRFFEDAILAYEKVTRQSEQEQLVHADALSRVVIPKMDFTMPDPPWKDLSDARDSNALQELQLHSIKTVLRQGGKKPPEWRGLKQVEDQLSWKFPTESVKKALPERFDVDGKALQGFVSDLKDEKIINGSELSWKPEGLRILNDEDADEDDEIEPGKFVKPPPADMSSLVKKRKMLIEEETSPNQKVHPMNTGTGPSRDSSKKARTEPSRGMMDDSIMGNLLGEKFSARIAVDNYMEMQGTKKSELSKSIFFSPKAVASSNRPLAPSTGQLHLNMAIRKSPLQETVEIPVPKYDIPLTPFYIVMSTAMYKKRDLVKCLERSLPSLTLIERDFTSHNTTSWLPGSVSRSPIISPLAAEADFIASPCLGIIVTTIQMISQKPLPGQKQAKSEIQSRVEQVSLRYENLLVLVSEDNKRDTTNGLDSYSSQALADLIGFKAGLDCNVIIQFVPGGDQMLSKWLMSAMVQHRSSEELLADQTHWELFLRRAGMNAFAAQVVLAQMKAPEGVNGSSPSKVGHFGLTGFVEMAKHERIARFESLCGRKLLKRVSETIEAGW